jgi:hypothetical protein
MTHPITPVCTLRFDGGSTLFNLPSYRNAAGRLMARWETGDGRIFRYRLRPDGTFGQGDGKVYGRWEDESTSR